MSPSFPAKISIPVTNHLTGETCLLQRMDQVVPSAGNLARITSISNEPENYRWLFQERLQGRPYNENDAEGFFRLGHNGWKSGDHFIFLLLTPTSRLLRPSISSRPGWKAPKSDTGPARCIEAS